MSNPEAIQQDLEFLVGEVKQLRKERADLLRRLSEVETGSIETPPLSASLTELGRLTEGIVHDIRNGLGTIRNTIGFMQDDLGGSRYDSDMLKIIRGLDYCELVLASLSALGGENIYQPHWINLETIIRRVYELLERKLVDVTLDLQIAPDVPEILADEKQISLAFMHLIRNAGEAMPDGGKLSVHIHCEGAAVCVELSDTGYGISEENRERVFQEFFTTKGRHFGIGLFVVQNIIKRHDGQIEVHSQAGRGTTFTVRLPIE